MRDNSYYTNERVIDGVFELKRTPKNFMPTGYDYIIVFQGTLEKVLTYNLGKNELKVFMFVLSQVGFENNLIMPGLQSLCSKKTNTDQSNVSRALKLLESLNIIIKEPIEFTKSYRYRINYELCAKDFGAEIKSKHKNDLKNNPIYALFKENETVNTIEN